MKIASTATYKKKYTGNGELVVFYFAYSDTAKPLACYFAEKPFPNLQSSLGIVGDYLVSYPRQYEAFCKLTKLPANEPSTYWLYLERHKTYSYH